MFMDQSNMQGQMSTVLEYLKHYKKKTLPVVKPGTQTRRFTHIMILLNLLFSLEKKSM